MKRRLLLLTPRLAPTAAARQFVHLATLLPRDRFDVQVATLECAATLADELRRADVELAVAERRESHGLSACRWLRRRLERSAPDVVHFWDVPAWLGSAVVGAASLGGRRRTVVSLTRQDSQIGVFGSLARRWWWRRADRVVVDNQFLARQCQQHGVRAERLTVLPCGVLPCGVLAKPSQTTTLEANAQVALRTELFAKIGLPADARLVATAGPLVSQRRLKDLAWAVDLLEAIHPEIHWLVFGTGPHRWRLERYVRQIQHENRIWLLGDQFDWRAFLPFVTCTWHAAEPGAGAAEILEAMAVGVPVVASDRPEVRRWIEDDKTGYLVKWGDRAEWARRTERLLSDAALAARLGEAGCVRLGDAGSIEATAGRFAELYTALD